MVYVVAAGYLLGQSIVVIVNELLVRWVDQRLIKITVVLNGVRLVALVLRSHGGHGYLIYHAWPVLRVCRELVFDMACCIGLADWVFDGLVFVDSGAALPLDHQHFVALASFLVPSEVIDLIATGRTGFACHSLLLFTRRLNNILSSKRCDSVLMILEVPSGLVVAQLLITVDRSGRSLTL